METIQNTTEINQPKVRPTFLTVLCILTFIGSGWALLQGVWNMITAEAQKAKMEQAMGQIDNMQEGFLKNFTQQSMEVSLQTFDNPMFGMLAILFAAASVFAALLMWKLKKNGYYIYTLVNVLGPLSLVLFMGVNTATIIMASGAGFISLIFIILYGLNLKHMS